MSKEFLTSQTVVVLARSFIRESQNAAKLAMLCHKAGDEEYMYLKEKLKKEKCKTLAQAKVFYDLIVENAKEEGIEVEFEEAYAIRNLQFEQAFAQLLIDTKQEHEEIYPMFVKVAEEEGYEEIAKKFKLMLQIKHCYVQLLEELAEKFKKDTLYKSVSEKEWHCTNCGFERKGLKAWDKCPFCGEEEGYVKIDLKKE